MRTWPTLAALTVSAVAHAGPTGTVPSGSGDAMPAALGAGAYTQLRATVTPGTNPASTGIEVRCDLVPIGDGADLRLFDDGAHGDDGAGDLVFGRVVEVIKGTPLGVKLLTCVVSDAEGRSKALEIVVTVIAACGDSALQPPEACDDGGSGEADGCDGSCAVEDGWACLGAPSDCDEICGDGLVVGDEGCDDAGDAPGDGCDGCQLEPGWLCTDEPSTCSRTALCGNGAIERGEACDDGNDASDDGCDATCQVEAEYECRGTPSYCCRGAPEVCFADTDGDSVFDAIDNCVDVPNRSQLDGDGDGLGDACDDEPAPDGDDGCCGGTSAPGAPMIALIGATLAVAVGRRRRPDHAAAETRAAPRRAP